MVLCAVFTGREPRLLVAWVWTRCPQGLLLETLGRILSVQNRMESEVSLC